jgi:hypothetical protein
VDSISRPQPEFKTKRRGPDDRAARWLRFGGIARLQGPAADAWALRLLRDFPEAREAALPFVRGHLGVLVAAVAGNARGNNRRGGGR